MIGRRLQRLKTLLRPSVVAFIVPTADPHLSEYVPECYKYREFITGFTGSAGTALVAVDSEKSYLWTDGRYFVQAQEQLDPSIWQLMRMGEADVPSLPKWIKENFLEGSAVGFDPNFLSMAYFRVLEKELQKKSLSLLAISTNLLELVWREEATLPPLPAGPILPHPCEYAGRTVEEKLSQVREKLASEGCSAVVVSNLDSVAWLLNIRGEDVPNCPVCIAYAVVTLKEAFLFVHEEKLTKDCSAHLERARVAVKPYNEAFSSISALSSSEKGKVWMDSTATSVAVFTLLHEDDIHDAPSPIEPLKAIKTESELVGMQTCHIWDGAAVVRWMSWLERQMLEGEKVTECSAGDRLAKFRAEGSELYRGESFDPIIGSGAHGAIVHYKAEEESCATIEPNVLLLADSGGQYLNGTTDITRTFLPGRDAVPSDHQKECFTAVLKGHIQLATAVFPKGTSGNRLDSFARRALWELGYDYAHGTGHGVGSYLNVHEGPHGISSRPTASRVGLSPGMVVTNEPGYYEESEFGIRIETVLVVKESPLRGKPFCSFETITLVPLQGRMISVQSLDRKELEWVNSYNQRCLDVLLPELRRVEDEAAVAWLRRNAEPLN